MLCVLENVIFVLHSQAGTNLAVLIFSLTATFQMAYSVTDGGDCALMC